VVIGGGKMFRRELKNKDCMDLSIEYERDNDVSRMETIENLYKQGVRVVTL